MKDERLVKKTEELEHDGLMDSEIEELEEEPTLESLNLLSNFLFTQAASYGEDGRRLCQIILETMLKQKLPYLRVEIQKVIAGVDITQHGIRMDVYLEEPEQESKKGRRNGEQESQGLAERNRTRKQPKESVYDIEMENKEFHPRRARYYHSLIDQKLLNAGADYRSLGNVIVLIIMPYDPFGLNLIRYTIKRRILEAVNLEYEDGDTTYYFNTKGTVGDGMNEVLDMLHYIEDSREENVKNSKIAEIHHIVQKVKQDKEVGVAYMKWADYYREKMEEGFEKGMEKGMEKGRELERENTEQERKRAEEAEKELQILREELKKYQKD